MKKILFFGVGDKTDLVLYIAKLLSHTQNVLISDGTAAGRYRWFMSDDKLTQYDSFHVAAVRHPDELLSVTENQPFDVMLIDCDNSFLSAWEPADIRFLVTSFDRNVLEPALVILEHYCTTSCGPDEMAPFYRIYHPYAESQFNDSYLVSITDNLSIRWAGEPMYTPYDDHDFTRKIENQYDSQISLKGLSKELKSVLTSVLMIITEKSEREIKLLFKKKG